MVAPIVARTIANLPLHEPVGSGEVGYLKILYQRD